MTKRVRTTRRLEVWLKDTSVALFVLNAHRRLVFFNLGCEQLTGWTAGDLLGQVCEFVSEADLQQPAAVLASLAAPSSVWNGLTTSTPISLARRNQESTPAFVHFYPLTDTNHKTQAALGIIQFTELPATTPLIPDSLQLHGELARLRHQLKQPYSESGLVCQSPPMRRVHQQLALARQSRLPVLFIGEEGCGREYLARIIHHSIDNQDRYFVPLDCRRLPAEQLESVLKRLKESEAADSQNPITVYFDHIQEMPREVQTMVVDLIRQQPTSQLRIMAASLRPLEEYLESDQVHRDLYFAMTSLIIQVPALRHRREDLGPLAQYFLEELNRSDSKQVDGFQEDVLSEFHRYNWPGNVAELRSAIVDARKQCGQALINSQALSFGFRAGVDHQSIGPAVRKIPVLLDPLLLQVEREQIELAIAEARQNKARAAELLGITRPRLYRRMEVLGIVDTDP